MPPLHEPPKFPTDPPRKKSKRSSASDPRLPERDQETTNNPEEIIREYQGGVEKMARIEKVISRYEKEGLPRDYRFAHEVHGAAFAPPWKWIWTEDETLSVDAHQNHLQNEINDVFNKNVLRLYRNKMYEATQQGGQASIETLRQMRDDVKGVTPTNPKRARLSNLVQRLEIVAVTYMRNLVNTQIRRRGKNYFRLFSVQQQLDISVYNHDIRALCRSLRRDDLTYTAFAGLVGTLVLEAVAASGTHAMDIMPTRLQNRRIGQALGEAVGLLAELPREIQRDEIGDNEEILDDEGRVLFLNHPQGVGIYDQARNLVDQRDTGVQIRHSDSDMDALAGSPSSDSVTVQEVNSSGFTNLLNMAGMLVGEKRQRSSKNGNTRGSRM